MHRLRVDSRVARELNRALVYDLMRDRQTVSRIGLARETGLSKATISQIIDQFIGEGLVEEIGPGEAHLGRRPTLLRFVPTARYAIGVELSDSSCSAILTDLKGAPVRRQSSALHGPSGDAAVAAAVALVDLLVADLTPDKLLGIGIGTPGLVDPRRGVIQTAPDLGWRDVAVGHPFVERFGVPATCLNRAKAAASGEAWRGAGERTDSFAYISVSTGISAGIVLNRRLYRGASTSEGEIGHVTVLPEGPLCACGNRGCLQTIAAGPAILARIREQLRAHPAASSRLTADFDLLTLEDAGRAAAAGDRLALAVVEEAAEYLGIAAANLVNVLNPRMLIFGGAVVRAIPDLVPRVEAVIRRRAWSTSAAAVEVVTSLLGRDAVPIGAATFLLSQVSPVVSDGVHFTDDTLTLPQVLHPTRRRPPIYN